MYDRAQVTNRSKRLSICRRSLNFFFARNRKFTDGVKCFEGFFLGYSTTRENVHVLQSTCGKIAHAESFNADCTNGELMIKVTSFERFFVNEPYLTMYTVHLEVLYCYLKAT